MVTRREPSSPQSRYVLDILPALLRSPFVARLVLGCDQRVGAATLFRREIEVAAGVADAALDMASLCLGCSEEPLSPRGVEQESAQLPAVGAFALERVRPGPIAGGFQRESDPRLQMVESRLPE